HRRSQLTRTPTPTKAIRTRSSAFTPWVSGWSSANGYCSIGRSRGAGEGRIFCFSCKADPLLSKAGWRIGSLHSLTLFQVGLDDIEQLFHGLSLLCVLFAVGIHHMKSDMTFDDLSHK